MFAYQTSSQLIIGLKSFHPLIRLIRENHFKKVVIIFESNSSKINHHNVILLFHKIKNRNTQCVLCPTDIRQDFVKIEKDVDLILSYGVRHIHDIAKQSNNFKARVYCIETIPGQMSSYGTGIV
jgi:glycerol dehydrogenase-like iron-containing ADH family enzyme